MLQNYNKMNLKPGGACRSVEAVSVGGDQQPTTAFGAILMRIPPKANPTSGTGFLIARWAEDNDTSTTYVAGARRSLTAYSYCWQGSYDVQPGRTQLAWTADRDGHRLNAQGWMR